MRRSAIVSLLHWLPAIICLSLVFYYSSQTYGQQTIVPALKRHISEAQLARILPDVSFRYGTAWISVKHRPFSFIDFLFRKVAHLFWYTSLCSSFFIGLNVFPYFSVRANVRRWVSGGLLILTAILDEWNQSSVAGRIGQPIDILLDVCGGMLIASILFAAVKGART